MVLVHDDDLALISGIHDSNVNKHRTIISPPCSYLQSLETPQPDIVENYLQGSNAGIRIDLCRKRLHVSRLLLISQEGIRKDISPTKNADTQPVRVAKLSMTSHELSE